MCCWAKNLTTGTKNSQFSQIVGNKSPQSIGQASQKHMILHAANRTACYKVQEKVHLERGNPGYTAWGMRGWRTALWKAISGFWLMV